MFLAASRLLTSLAQLVPRVLQPLLLIAVSALLHVGVGHRGDLRFLVYERHQLLLHVHKQLAVIFVVYLYELSVQAENNAVGGLSPLFDIHGANFERASPVGWLEFGPLCLVVAREVLGKVVEKVHFFG